MSSKHLKYHRVPRENCDFILSIWHATRWFDYWPVGDNNPNTCLVSRMSIFITISFAERLHHAYAYSKRHKLAER